MSAIGFLVAALLTTAAVLTVPATVGARTVGQVIDDTAITAQVKTRLAADQLSNLTRIEVSTDNGIVTLGGVVEDPVRAARAAQIASGVDGVRGIVNRIHVAGTTIPPVVTTTPPPAVSAYGSAPGMSVDATGVIATIDPSTRTLTLQDGRVIRLTDRTIVWQPVRVDALRPGAQVYVREAAPVTVQPTAATAEWRMGTVRTVDHTTNQLVLTDGTVVRLTPGALVRRGSERLPVEQIVPGSEIVVRTIPRTASAEGSALPGAVATSTIDATELNVVWTPVNGSR